MSISLSNDRTSGDDSHLEQLTAVLSALEENCIDKWSLASMSDVAGMGQSNFSHEFRKFTGLSPNQYLMDLRLQRAAFLLETTDMPVGRLAHESGFASHSYFSRKFLERYKMRPLKYRKETDGRLN